MRAKCPECGHEFPLQTRREMGRGTAISPDAPLRENESRIIGLEDFKVPLTVREVQGLMVAKGFKPNYHTVQAALSTLVGRGRLKMDATNYWPPRYWKS